MEEGSGSYCAWMAVEFVSDKEGVLFATAGIEGWAEEESGVALLIPYGYRLADAWKDTRFFFGLRSQRSPSPHAWGMCR